MTKTIRKPFELALSLLAAAVLAGGCGNDTEPNLEPAPGEEVRSDKQRTVNPVVPAGDLATQVDGNNAFALELYQAASADPGNLFFSPHSITVALAMLHAGARGNTETEIADTLSYVLPQSDLHAVFNKLDLDLTSRGTGSAAADGGQFRLNIVNSIWGQTGYSFLPDYLDTIALNYGAGLQLLDFFVDPEHARGVINTWVEDQTEQRIKDLLPPGSIISDTKLVLTNAIYFNAAWATPFEPAATQPGSFDLIDGSTAAVPFMSGTVPGQYLKQSGLEVAALPYDGDELSMVIIVPEPGSFAAVEQSLTGAKVSQLTGALQQAELTLTLPKWELEARLDAKRLLQSMGMHDVFDARADLSGINGKDTLFVSDVLHKAFVKVNEAGTEAAAATAVVLRGSAAPQVVELTVDRPFIYLIRDHATGAILFVGRVVNPA